MTNGALVHLLEPAEPDRHDLASISSATCEVVWLNPFTCVARIQVRLQTSDVLSYDITDVTASRHFVAELNAAAAAAVTAAAAAAAATVPAAPSAPTAPPTAAPTAAALSSAQASKTPTKRVQEGRKLRDQLLLINRLQHQGSAAEAAELANSLEAETPADGAKLDALARQRVRQLRDTAFSFGGLPLTREIVQRFCDMPEVRPMLQEHVLERRRNAVDGETGRLLIEAAKEFFSVLLKAPRGEGAKTGGRRTDDDRNAFAAALAALLPRDLFENRRGRAAMRLLGLTYAQAKRGTETRGEMEDRGHGWKRLVTSQHYDKVTPAQPACRCHSPPHLAPPAPPPHTLSQHLLALGFADQLPDC